MAKPEIASPESADDAVLDDGAYDAPAGLRLDDERLTTDEEELSLAGTPPERPASRARGSGPLRIAIALGVVILAGAGLLVYRGHHRRAVLEAGLAEAGRLVALDTAAGYREAARKLEPLAGLDPLRAGSLRAFALGMLFADYRVAAAERDAEALLVVPGRASEVPPEANLAFAALALGRREAGSALTAATRAGELPSALAIQARVALLAGNVGAAEDPARVAADAALPAGLALHGDVLRRLRRDPAAASAEYERALEISPTHPRAAYGLAKLALAGAVQPALAVAPLERILADAEHTPAPERGRAALHLATLRLRAGDRAGARAALDGAGLDGPARAWAEIAAAVAAPRRGPYRAVSGAPASIRSASDDDPGALAPIPPAPPRPAAKAQATTRATTTKRTTTTRRTATTAKPSSRRGR
jgi:tetratricopeptide (TPR) repeat protein